MSATRSADEPRVPPGISTSTWAELEALSSMAPPAQILEGLIAERERVLLYGYSSVGKSILARELAIAVHRGEAFAGEIPTSRARAGIIDEESPAQRLGEQLAKVARGRGLDPQREDLPVFAVMQGARLDTPAGVDAIAAWTLENELGLVVIDTLIRTHRLRENEAEDMARIDEALRRLQGLVNRPLTIVLVHHAPKPRENGGSDAATMARGSSDLFASADSALYVRRGRDAGEILVEHAKARWTLPRPSFLLKLESDDTTLRVRYAGGVDQVAAVAERAIELVVAALREGPRSRPELLERGKAAKVSPRSIDDATKALGVRIVRSRSGRNTIYSLADGGLLVT